MVRPAERLLPTPSMKMAELIAVSPSLPGVLTRMGIPFGFGDETVEEVCRRNGTDPETFLLICSVYSGDGSLPAKERIRKADLKDVLKYLRRSHAYYMEVAMKEITAALVALTEPCDERHRNIIRKFFNERRRRPPSTTGVPPRTTMRRTTPTWKRNWRT